MHSLTTLKLFLFGIGEGLLTSLMDQQESFSILTGNFQTPLKIPSKSITFLSYPINLILLKSEPLLVKVS